MAAALVVAGAKVAGWGGQGPGATAAAGGSEGRSAAMAATGLPPAAGLAVRAVMPELHGCWWCCWQRKVALMVPGRMAEPRRPPQSTPGDSAAAAPMGIIVADLAEGCGEWRSE